MQKGANELVLPGSQGNPMRKWLKCCLLSRCFSLTQIHTSSKNKLLLNYSCVNITSKHTQNEFHFTVLLHTRAHTLKPSINPQIHFIFGLTDLCLLNLSATWMEETGWRETPCQSLWNTLCPSTVCGKKKNLTERSALSSCQTQTSMMPSSHTLETVLCKNDVCSSSSSACCWRWCRQLSQFTVAKELLMFHNYWIETRFKPTRDHGNVRYTAIF